jgi:hypothetical protein
MRANCFHDGAQKRLPTIEAETMTKSKETKTGSDQIDQWVERFNKKHLKATNNNRGAIFTRQGKDNPLVQAVNAVTERERRRKIN